MIRNYYTPSGPKILIYSIVLLCVFLTMAWLVRGMYRRHDPGPINQARAEERLKAKMELAVTNTVALTTPGWVDSARGIVRLPIARAAELTIERYKNPEAARSNLIARVQKAAAPAPERPSEFE
jgi:hypothetical protein